MIRLPFACFVWVCAFAAASWAQTDARLLRWPDVSATQIVFVYAGDIWIVDRIGGEATRLSSPKGEESYPRFSPDGSTIAFSANYDGNTDIYTMPVTGGVPARLTHHPSTDRMVEWRPDGDAILYATGMTSGKSVFNQLYTVSTTGGLPAKLPMPYGEFGSYSPDGNTLAYMPIDVEFRTWKRYRGGRAPDIWLFNLQDLTSQRMTQDIANDSMPMWHDGKVYFTSDRDDNKRTNIWVHDPETGSTTQVTYFGDFDVRFPSMGPDSIVFENGGQLYLLELPGYTQTTVSIHAVTDKATLKPRAESVAKALRSAEISPAGKRAVFEARGDLFSVPAAHGPVLNLTHSPGSADRYPAWSPDGKNLAYWSDREGEYALILRAWETGAEEAILSPGPGYRYRPQWSPDSKKIAFVDQTMRLFVLALDTREAKEIDQGLYWSHPDLEAYRVSWSGDSRWLAYHRETDNQRPALFVHDTQTGEAHQLTSGFHVDTFPAFDPGGKYLYFLTTRSLSPIYSDFDNTWIYTNSTQLAALPLRKDVPSPLAPRNDFEGDKKKDRDKKGDETEDGASEEKDADAGEKGEAKGDEEEKPVEPVAIDFDGMEGRVVILPPKPGNFGPMAAVKGKIVYQRTPRTGSDSEENPIFYYDLEEREEKKILDHVTGFRPAAGGGKLLAWKDNDYSIVEIKEGQKLDKKLPTGGLEASVDPLPEWRQLFAEAWRIERDFFYDPNMHGVNWPEMRRRYGALIEQCSTRWDVNFLLGELISELNAGHTYRGGGDLETPLERQVGLLGADYTLENNAYRIAHIVRGAAWDSEVRSPLDRPGVDVREGDYLLAVNGVPLDPSQDPWAAFQGLAGVTVELIVNASPAMEGARKVLVETLSSEYRLRNLEWIEGMRKRVDEASGGKIGYVYVPDTGTNGQTELIRMYLAQSNKEGLIIDERFNSGGQIPDRFVELMNRPVSSYWGVRDGRDWVWPPSTHLGHKAMLINGWAGSGGDAFPFFFRQAGLGPLIGTRTWGGLIGISGTPPLLDGGNVTAPTFGIYSTDGEWIIEGHGVDPDIEVVDDPSVIAGGGDPQLERAVAEVLARIEADPRVHPAKPAYPIRSGR